MEGRRDHRLPVVALALVAFLTTVPSAWGDSHEPPTYNEELVTTTVYTNDDSVSVESEYQGHSEGVSGTGTQASGSAPRCYLRNYPTSEWEEDMTMEFFYYRMQKQPWKVICGGEWRGTVWLPIPEDGESTPGSAEPRDVAMQLRDRMPIPRVNVSINPSRGLVGVDAWFWLEGYEGAPLTNSTDAFGDLVQVEARVERYEWSFGDGATFMSETPGEAYPARSSVRHMYERSSAGLTHGYSVDVNFVFSVRYRVDGGRWLGLPGITRTAHADYNVRESQAVIQR